jgi:hypothetical protein
MDFQDAYTHADVLAIAPYFSAFTATPTGTVDEIIALCREEMQTKGVQNVSDLSVAATARGLKLVAYEGGQHLTAYGDATKMDNLIAANSDPRMKDLYLEYLDIWKQNGGTLFMHFSSVAKQGPYGSWGSKEYWSQPRAEAPKYDALLTWIDNNPAWFTIPAARVETSVEATMDAANVKIYPNPANELVNIETTADNANVSITDLSGKLVYQNQMSGSFQTISTQNLKSGLYIVTVKSGNSVERQKLVIE